MIIVKKVQVFGVKSQLCVQMKSLCLKLFFCLFFFVEISFVSKTEAAKKIWTGTWATAPQIVEPHNMPPAPGLANSTLRQIVRVSIGGDVLKLKLTNIFSKQLVEIKRVTIAVVRQGETIDVNTLKTLRFNGDFDVSIPAGKETVSDEVRFKLTPGTRLSISIAFGQVPNDITGHPGSRTTSYILAGNNVYSSDFNGSVPTNHWCLINSIDVKSTSKAAAIAVLGNSIADGRGSGTNKQNRWPDVLSQRLLHSPQTSSVGVLNLGIGGNCVLRRGLGPTALYRFERDILSQSNVKWLILSIGVNDIGGIRTEAEAPKLVEELIMAYKLMVDKAHAKGIKVYGTTILPFSKSFYDSAFRLDARDKVNQWIRTSGVFDQIIDFDQLMRNPCDTSTILPELHSGDFLHPNELGLEKMGNAIDVNLFKQ